MALRVRVCRQADVLAGEVNAFPVEGVTWPVILTVVDGEIMACPGVCPHEDVPLEYGELRGAVITCPGHGYAFDLHTGKCRHDPDLELRRYPVTVIDGEVWVDLVTAE